MAARQLGAEIPHPATLRFRTWPKLHLDAEIARAISTVRLSRRDACATASRRCDSSRGDAATHLDAAIPHVETKHLAAAMAIPHVETLRRHGISSLNFLTYDPRARVERTSRRLGLLEGAKPNAYATAAVMRTDAKQALTQLGFAARKRLATGHARSTHWSRTRAHSTSAEPKRHSVCGVSAAVLWIFRCGPFLADSGPGRLRSRRIGARGRRGSRVELASPFHARSSK